MPRLIAICGAPTAGKSTVAEMIALNYDAEIVDDGKVLRDACMALYGAPAADFYSQAGKEASREVCGGTYTNRQLLGDLGELLEGFYGDQFMPEQALRSILAGANWRKSYVFPSCRKNQGLTYLAHEGVVLEVMRPGCHAVNAFDRYDRNLVTHSISNDCSLEHLQDRVVRLFDTILGGF